MPLNDGPGLSPEEAAKTSALIELLGEGIAQNWWKKGYWQRFADVIFKRIEQKGGAQTGGQPRVSPSVPCVVQRYDVKGQPHPQTTTVADLLAEIADNQLDTIDAISDLTDALRMSLREADGSNPKSGKRNRRRS